MRGRLRDPGQPEHHPRPDGGRDWLRLGAILHSQITLGANGAVQKSNFDGYPSLRTGEMPRVQVTIIKSDAESTGVGEPGALPIGPAVGSGWRADGAEGLCFADAPQGGMV